MNTVVLDENTVLVTKGKVKVRVTIFNDTLGYVRVDTPGKCPRSIPI